MGPIQWGKPFTNETFSMLYEAWLRYLLLCTPHNVISLMILGCITCKIYVLLQFYCWFMLNLIQLLRTIYAALKNLKQKRLNSNGPLLHILCHAYVNHDPSVFMTVQVFGGYVQFAVFSWHNSRPLANIAHVYLHFIGFLKINRWISFIYAIDWDGNDGLQCR